MLVFIFIIASASIAVPITNAASDCSICQLGNYFVESNGYGCFALTDERIACTCPDQLYTVNQPCRICARTNICGGDDLNAFCAETAPISLGVQTNDTHLFACFCPDMSFRVGEACPSMPIPRTTPAIAPQKN